MSIQPSIWTNPQLLAVAFSFLPISLSAAADRPAVFFTDASHFEIQTGNDGDGFDLKLQYPTTRTGFSLTLPVAGDWDGDGLDGIGVYDFGAAQFHLRNECSPGDDDIIAAFGEGGGGDKGPAVYPIVGDWDGDGTDTIGTYDNVNQRFQLRNSNTAGPPDLDFVFGLAASIPVSGDYDGDGDDSIGVYTPADGTFHLKDTNTAGAAEIVVQFGPVDGFPIIGDWDGDGVDTIGVLDTTANEISVRNSHSPGPADLVIALRTTRWPWRPIAGNWHVPSLYPPEPGYPWSQSTPAAENIDPELLNQAYGQASLNESLYSLLVVRHGKLVREEYFGGCERGMGGNVKSVSKSFLSALVGIAAENGQFASINDTVAAIMPSLFKNQTDPRKFDIEIQHVVTMTTRLGWNENNLGPWFASDNPHQYVIDQPMSGNPGTAFLYSTGLTHLAGAMLREVTGMEPPDYAAQNLLNPLGIKVQRWDVDRQGDYIGGAEVYITPRDMARFGELYLRGGTLDSNGIVPADWVSWSTSELVPDAWVSGSRSYGAWWWRDTFGDHGAYFAWGYGGQFIFVVPNLDLVVVATSDWTVSQQAAGSQASAIFNLLDDWILPSVLPDPEGIVPAVSEWGAIAMALLLLTSGSLMFRRQFAAA